MKTGIKVGIFCESTTQTQQSPEICASGLDEQNTAGSGIDVGVNLPAFGKNFRFNKVVIMVIQPYEVHAFV